MTRCMVKRTTTFSLAILISVAAPAFGAVLGQVDDFEDGTTQGWVVGVAMGAVHPAPPANVADGGPLGAGDNYLQLTSIGGAAAGSRLAVLNLSQWTGNYLADGIGLIAMDLMNLGNTDLALRLYLENPMAGPPTDDAVTDAFLLPAGAGWQRAIFNVGATGLTALNGDLNTLLSNVTAIRIIHNPDPTFPPPAVTSVLGVDNIAAIPEPSALVLVASGIALVLAVQRRRRIS